MTEKSSTALAAIVKASEEVNTSVVAWKDLEEKVLPSQQKGIIIPHVDQMIRTAQGQIARSLDGLLAALAEHGPSVNSTDPEVITPMEGVTAAYQDGVIHVQGIVFSIHLLRLSSVLNHKSPCARMIAEAYMLLERAQNMSGG